MSKTTISKLDAMKQAGEKIVALTSYDASFAAASERAGVDVLLVGDSLGTVVQGHDSTLPVTLEQMVYHSANVARVAKQAMIVTDLPFMTYATPVHALESAGRLMKEGGAHMVKLEGGAPMLDKVKCLTEHAVPVCGHLGLLPQSVNRLGGYRVQARDAADADTLLRDAEALQAAGAQMLVVECIPRALADEVSRLLRIPVIGIGSGELTDGQVLVVYDMLGLSVNHIPRFARNFLADNGGVSAAIAAYVESVRDGSFPAAEHVLA